MRTFRLLTLGLVMFLFLPLVMAQGDESRRTSDLADRLVGQTQDLADRSYSWFTNNSRNSRADIEGVYQDEQLNASAALFRRMVRDRRSRAELQDTTVLLSDLARRADRFGRQRSLISDIQRTISDIQRNLNFGGGIGIGGGGPVIPGGVLSGSMRWRGTIDDIAQIRVQESYAEVNAVSGTPYSDATFSFTSPLPYRRVSVRLNKISGRGDMRIIQQPSRDNDFTAVIEIRDTNRGPASYEFEISW